jgi:hypothetical protein
MLSDGHRQKRRLRVEQSEVMLPLKGGIECRQEMKGEESGSWCNVKSDGEEDMM